MASSVHCLEHVWIPMADGTRLAARIWLPEEHPVHPVPAILEYIPYRKNDATMERDATIHPYFAAHGYASVRVDLRGSGDSEGLMLDEYLPQEQDDGVEVIAWLAAQPWCSGRVGMIGKSWGGFNGLQIAARRPPALGAVISVCSTDDRYADDVHYIGGCVLASDMLSWASTMLAANARPPDPTVVGDAWRRMWMERLERQRPWVEGWLAHQRRDAYWQHGSICEDFDAIEVPVYMVGGWNDGYPNAIPRFLEGASCPRKGLIGPWAHLYPHHALPGPEIGFLQECLRFWDHCLKGVDNGVLDEPMLRAWLQDPVAPAPGYPERPGRWVAEPVWPPADPGELRLHLAAAGLAPEPGEPAVREIGSDERQGRDAGNWIGWGRDNDWPTDQRFEDALALSFDSAPLEADVEALGFVHARLRLAADRPSAFVAVRLCEVDEEGRSTLITRGILNLTHRASHEHPEPMEPGRFEDVEVRLKVIGHRFAAGHRLRVAVTPAYWPWVWPSPTPVRISLETGAASWVSIPVRAPRLEDEALAPFEPPAAAPSPAFTRLPHRAFTRTVIEDVSSGRMEIVNDFDFFGCRRLPDGLEYTEAAQDRFSIVQGDPLSAQVTCVWEMNVGRGEWRTRVATRSTMSATETHFIVVNDVEAFEGAHRVFVQSRTREILRDLV
jgi:putative CocE/NonD family hydrolase